jgi:hypothetical protein
MYLSVRIGTFLNRSTEKYYKPYKKEEELVIFCGGVSCLYQGLRLPHL